MTESEFDHSQNCAYAKRGCMLELTQPAHIANGGQHQDLSQRFVILEAVST